MAHPFIVEDILTAKTADDADKVALAAIDGCIAVSTVVGADMALAAIICYRKAAQARRERDIITIVVE